MQCRPVVLLGDFNIHWDKHVDSHVKRVMELIDPVNIIQHVQKSTHIDGTIIVEDPEKHALTSL